MICVLTFSAAILFSAVVAAQPPDCNLKEDAWCETLTNARTCGAFSYCLTAVWPKGVKEDELCHEGQGFVKQFHQAMMAGHQKAQDLTKLCRVFDAEKEQSCQALLKENQAEMVQLVNSTMRSSSVAKILNLCSTPLKFKKEEKICTDCKEFLKDIEARVIGPNIEQMMKKELESLCKQLPSTAMQLCLSLADDWIKHFFQFLNEELKFDHFCYVASFCSKWENNPYTNKPFRLIKNDITDLTCSPCKEAMTILKDMMDNPGFQTDAEIFLEFSVCTFLPIHMIKTCKDKIKGLASFLFDFLDAEMDSQTMCQILRLCSAQVGDSAKHQQAFMDGVKSAYAIVSEDVLPFVKLFTSSNSECGICQFFMREVEKILSQQHSKDQITAAFDRLCMKLPQPWAKQCKDFVDSNANDIIDSIIGSLSPKQMCETIGFCEVFIMRQRRASGASGMVNMQQAGDVNAQHMLHNSPKEAKADSPWCRFCHSIAGIAQRLLGSKQLNTAIQIIETNLCSLLPRAFAAKCRQMASDVVGALLAGLSTVTDPGLVCGEIGVCVMELTPMKYNVTLPDILNVKTNN